MACENLTGESEFASGDVVLEHRPTLAETPAVAGHQGYSKNVQSLPDFQTSQAQGSTVMLKATSSNQSPNQSPVRLGCGGKSVLPRSYAVAGTSFCGSGGLSGQRSRHKLQSAFQFHSGVVGFNREYAKIYLVLANRILFSIALSLSLCIHMFSLSKAIV